MGFYNAARIDGSSVTAALRNYLDQAVDTVEEAVQEEQEAFLERQQARMADDPAWGAVGPSVASWEDEGGNYAHGVRGDAQAVTQAGLAEFGDDQRPPSPLLRMGAIRDASLIRRNLLDRFRQGGF